MAKQALISDILDFRTQRENVKSKSFSNLLDKETGNQGSELLKPLQVLSLRAVTGILESNLNSSLYFTLKWLFPYFIIFTILSKIFLFVPLSCFMYILATFLIAMTKCPRETISKHTVYQGKMAMESGLTLSVAAGALTVWLVRSHRLESESCVWNGAGLYSAKPAPTPPQPPTSFSQALLLKGSTISQHSISSWKPSIQIHEPAGDFAYNNNASLDFKITS